MRVPPSGPCVAPLLDSNAPGAAAWRPPCSKTPRRRPQNGLQLAGTRKSINVSHFVSFPRRQFSFEDLDPESDFEAPLTHFRALKALERSFPAQSARQAAAPDPLLEK